MKMEKFSVVQTVTVSLALFCVSRTLSFGSVLEFSTTRQEKLDVKTKAIYA